MQIVAQLLSFPMGKAWAKLVPNVKVFGVSLNPGPFSIKEHVSGPKDLTVFDDQ
jgi:hypothetical protein